MDKNIVSVFDYNSLDISSLMYLYTHFKSVSSEKKYIILDVICDRYLQTRDFNLYSFLNKSCKLVLRNERDFKIVLSLITRELNSTTDLNVCHVVDFMTLFLFFIEFIESSINSINSNSMDNILSVDWSFIESSKLLGIVALSTTLNIESVSFQNKLKTLVINIKKQLDGLEAEENPIDSSVASVASVASLAIKNNQLCTIQEDFKNITEYKLKKSMLQRKSEYLNCLQYFSNYSESDKTYLVMFAIKKNWIHELTNIDPLVAFCFFKEHHFSSNNKFYNSFLSPFVALESCFHKLRYNTVLYADLKSYFKAEDFSDLMEKVKMFYYSYDGSSELGWSLYKQRLLSWCNYSNTLVSTDEFIDYTRNIGSFDFYKDIEIFGKYENLSILDLVRNTVKPKTYTLKDIKFVSLTTIVEFIECKDSEITVLEHYWEIYAKYNYVLFGYTGNSMNVKNLNIWNLKDLDINSLYETVNGFVSFLESISFTKSDLLDISTISKIYNTKKLDNAITNYFISYFCHNFYNLDKNFALTLLTDLEFLHLFKRYVNFNRNSGYFHTYEDFITFLFELVKDEFNFSNIQELQNFFDFGINIRHNTKLYRLFIDKFKSECPNCYIVLNDYLFGLDFNSNDNIISIIGFIKTYYSIS